MPLYAAISEIPRSFEIGDHWVFDRNSARWAFDYVDFHAQVVYYLAIQDVRKAQEKWEKSVVDKTPAIDKAALELYKADPDSAAKFLNDYCMNNADRVFKAWWNLGVQLLVKYNHLWIYEVKTRERKPMKYPDWWLKELVKYNQRKPEKKKDK